MKTLFWVLCASLAAILVAVGALRLRLHWHLRRSRSVEASKHALPDIEPAQRANRN